MWVVPEVIVTASSLTTSTLTSWTTLCRPAAMTPSSGRCGRSLSGKTRSLSTPTSPTCQSSYSMSSRSPTWNVWPRKRYCFTDYTLPTKFGRVYRNRRLSVHLSVLSILTLAITFDTKKGLLYYTCVFLVRTPFHPYKNFLTSWPWPWLLTYFWKKHNLRHSFWIFLVARPFCGNKIFDPVTLTSNFDLHLKKLNLGNNFWTKKDRAFILRMCILCGKTFLSVPKFLSHDLDLQPWPYFEKK